MDDITIMPAQEWLSAEKFLNNVLPLLFGIIGVSLLILIFSFLYFHNKKTKGIVIIICIALISISGSMAFIKTREYKSYTELVKNETPAIRDRKKKTFRYEYYEKEAPKEFDAMKLNKLPFYSKKAIQDKESITFLGRTDHVYYVKIYNNLFNLSVNSDNIEFSKNVQKPIRTGYTYMLQDKEYKDIGFYDKIGPIYTKLTIPKEMEEKRYEDIDERSEQLKF